MNGEERKDFRSEFRLGARPLFGTFVKSSSPDGIEILGDLGFDFVVVDTEHAPFGRPAVDVALLAAKAVSIAALVRVPVSAPEYVLAALDDGATGVLAPHISSAEDAKRLVSYCRYSGRRGFSNSPRAGAYGAKSMWQHVDEADAMVTVIAMIEDEQAIEKIDEILAVEGIDGIFIGRGDLAVALNDRELGTPRVKAATDIVTSAARRAGKPVCVLAANAAEAASLRLHGVSAFVISSDQGLLRSGAGAALNDFRGTFDKVNR